METERRPAQRYRKAIVVAALELLFVIAAWLIGWPVFAPFNLFMVGVVVLALAVVIQWLSSLLQVPAAGKSRPFQFVMGDDTDYDLPFLVSLAALLAIGLGLIMNWLHW
jgi:uncharacterized membrane protein